MSKMISLDEQLKKMAEDVVDDRVEQWARYYFEKELLPSLKYEIKERLLIQLLCSMEKHSKIELKIEFTPHPTDDSAKPKPQKDSE